MSSYQYAVVTYRKNNSTTVRRDWFDISTSGGQQRKEAVLNNRYNDVSFIDYTDNPKYFNPKVDRK